MMMTWLILAAGFVLLIVGAELLVRGAARLAADFGVPTLVIGLTVVAFGTSAPELAVSIKSAYEGQTELAIANVVGSNIVNILAILGLSAVIVPLAVSQQLIRQDVPIMIAVSVIAVVMAWDGAIVRWEAGLLVLGLVAYTTVLFRQGRKQGAAVVDPEIGEVLQAHVPAWRNFAFVVLGLILLVIGARWLVQSAVEIAQAWGVSEAVIGLTIVAAGTSLPEVMTSVMAALRGERDIAIGNVVGSNIFNILSVLGIAGVVAPTPLLAGSQLAQIDIPVMLGVAVLCLHLFFVGAQGNRFGGLLLLLLYLAYVSFMIATATKSPHLEGLQTSILYGLIPFVLLYVVVSLIVDLRRRRQA